MKVARDKLSGRSLNIFSKVRLNSFRRIPDEILFYLCVTTRSLSTVTSPITLCFFLWDKASSSARTETIQV